MAPAQWDDRADSPALSDVQESNVPESSGFEFMHGAAFIKAVKAALE